MEDNDGYGKMMELIHQKKHVPRIVPPVNRWEVTEDGTAEREYLGVKYTIRNVKLED